MTNLMLISSNSYSSSHLKIIHIHQNLPSTYLTWTLKSTHFFIFKNGVMPSFLSSANTCQKTRSGWNTNILQHIIMKYLPLSCHRKPILNLLNQNKTLNHSPENYEFILLNMTLLIHPNHHNHMSRSLHKWTLTMALTFSLMLSLTWVTNV